MIECTNKKITMTMAPFQCPNFRPEFQECYDNTQGTAPGLCEALPQNNGDDEGNEQGPLRLPIDRHSPRTTTMI